MYLRINVSAETLTTRSMIHTETCGYHAVCLRGNHAVSLGGYHAVCLRGYHAVSLGGYHAVSLRVYHAACSQCFGTYIDS
jgi:hypothetical protein